MAAQSSSKNTPLAQELLGRPYRFDFFQAVRIQERLFQDRGRVGQDLEPAREAVRFRALQGMSFPASAVVELNERKRERQGASSLLEMVVSFMGLTGPSGVLPLHYSRLLIERIREKDLALRDFFDLFNHRMISLFFRAWEKYRFPTVYERSHLDSSRKEEEPFTASLFSLVGLGTKGLRGRLEVHDQSFLHYSGLFSSRHRPATSLKRLLADFFGLDVEILEFQGQWLPISPEERSSISSRSSSPRLNNILGVNVALGDRVWDVQSKFRVLLGPVTYRQYLELIPDGSALKPLCQLVRSYVGPEHDFDVQVVLKAPEIPPLRLESRRDVGPRLGWNTWLISGPAKKDSRDPVFALKEI